MIAIGVSAYDREAILTLGLELLDKGLEFSDSWLLDPGSHLYSHSSLELSPFQIPIVTYLVRFRLVNEVLDGSTN